MNPNSFLGASLLVGAGGAFGAWLRFVVNRLTPVLLGQGAAGAFPWATLACNVLGSLAMGALVGWLGRSGSQGEGLRLLLGVGVLGGFTTFSSFALEFVALAERGPLGLAAGYVAVSLLAGFGALFAGLALTRLPQ